MRPIRTIIDWLEHRTGIETAVKNFLYEDIPASAGWHQIIGSMAVFFFVIQVVTGALLAFNYAPTPGEAYNSVKYIMTELTGGPLIRGLHHWGASMMLIIVVLHMIQVFIYGAYKKPREATWIDVYKRQDKDPGRPARHRPPGASRVDRHASNSHHY